MSMRSILVMSLLASCTASKAPEVVPGLPPFALDAEDARAIAEGAIEHGLSSWSVREAGSIEMRLVGSDAPLPREAGGLKLLPFATPIEHDRVRRAELVLTDRVGDELFVVLRVLNPIGGPTVTTMRFSHVGGAWEWAETLSVEEFL